MSEIEEEAYSEVCEENERLKAEIRKVETLWFSEGYRMRDLLKRAADALEKWCVPMRHPESKLIAELRKAAE